MADPLPQDVTVDHLGKLLRSPVAITPLDDDADRNIDERIENVARTIELELVAWDQIKLSTLARYLVKNLLPAGGLVVVYGPPKCGKTFWIFDLVMHVALGWEYRKRRTQQGTVVYCLFEGQRAFTARVEAFRQSRLAEHADGVPFFLMSTRIALVNDHPKLIAAIKQRAGLKPAVVVLDTLNRSFTGSENSDQDMTAYVSAADAIREAFDCAVIIVHHSGLETGRPRGHTALFGAVDALISVRKDTATKNVTATVENLKDGAEGEIVTSRLEVVEVGLDDDREPITSCIVEPSEAEPKSDGRGDLTKNQKTMLGILYDAGPAGLTVEEWNARARAASLGLARKPDLYDFRSALLKKGHIFQGEHGWFAKRS